MTATETWRGWDSNPRHEAYESPALPLSYLANHWSGKILLCDGGFVNSLPVKLFPNTLNAW